jgi:hypothetical protein
MSFEDIVARLLNPLVVATMSAAGAAYGYWFLWEMNLKPAGRLWAGATFGGLMFILVVWAIRGAQGTLSAVYLALSVDWLIFSTVGVLTVLARRRWRNRR